MNADQRAQLMRARRLMHDALNRIFEAEQKIFPIVMGKKEPSRAAAADTYISALETGRDLLAGLVELDELIPDIAGPRNAAANAKGGREADELAEKARLMRERGRSVPQIAEALNRSERHTKRYFEGDKSSKRQ